MEDFNDLLTEMLRTEYVNAAFVVDDNGYMLAQRIRRLPNTREALPIQTLVVQGAIDRLGAQLGLGGPHQMMLEFDAGVAMLAPFALQRILVVIATPSVTLGLFRTFFGMFLQRFTKHVLASNSQAEGAR